MTTHQLTPSEAAFAAIDIAKYRNEVLIEAPGQRRRRLTVLNTRVEHDRLVATLSALRSPVVAGFEATGNYHRPLAWRLLEAGFEVRLINLEAAVLAAPAVIALFENTQSTADRVDLLSLRQGNLSLAQHADDLFRGVAFAAHSNLLFSGQNAPDSLNRPGPLSGCQASLAALTRAQIRLTRGSKSVLQTPEDRC